MGNIVSTYFISHNDGQEFGKQLNEAVDKLQKMNLYAEVQYGSNLTSNQVMFSVLILGREKGDKDNG